MFHGLTAEVDVGPGTGATEKQWRVSNAIEFRSILELRFVAAGTATCGGYSMQKVSLKTLLPRVFLFSLLVGAGATALSADAWKCPNCYRCTASGCSLGSDKYGFDDCAENPPETGGCNPNNGNPCCASEEE